MALKKTLPRRGMQSKNASQASPNSAAAQQALLNALKLKGVLHFDSGGAVPSGSMVQGGNNVSGGVQEGFGNTPGGQLYGNAFGNALQSGAGGAGEAATGVGADFTAQNQFQAQNAPIQYGTNATQLNTAYQGAQGGLNQLNSLSASLTPGVQQAANAQGMLSSQLSMESAGLGPNPAQAQYAANIQNLAAQQAGAISSQKGISPALANAQIARQGGAAMQNAAAQGATLQAQQQLAAQQNLQNLSANQVAQGAGAIQGVNNAQQNEQNILQGANTSANNALVSSQNSTNSINAQVAGQNASATNNTLGGLMNGASSLAALFAKGGVVGETPKYAPGGVVGPSTSGPQSYFGQWLSSQNPGGSGGYGISNSPSANPLPVADTTQSISKGMTGLGKSFMPSKSSANSTGSQLGGSMGSQVGGSIGSPSGDVQGGPAEVNYNAAQNPSDPDMSPLIDLGGMGYAGGGKVDALVSPGEKRLTAQQAKQVATGQKNIKQVGEKFPGKPKIKGNSYDNDTIPKKLTIGDIIIPNSVMQSANPAQGAHDFVARIMMGRKKK